jgi:hypothetical protein
MPSSSDNSDNVINNEEINIMNQAQNLQEWNLPLVPTINIYKQSTFSNLYFLSDYTIKTVERTFSLNKEYETIKLFSKNNIEKHKQKYSFIHIGLVQVAIKPLTRQWLNNSVLLCLIDGRHLNFRDSLLGSIESSLYEGSLYFNCHPNFSLSLFDPTLLQALELNIKTHGYNMMKGSQPLAIVHRIYYKLMKTTLEPQAFVESPKGQTLLLQCNTQNSTICTLKQISWDDIVSWIWA